MSPDDITDLIDKYLGLKLYKPAGDWELEAAKQDLNDAVRFIKNEATRANMQLQNIKDFFSTL